MSTRKLQILLSAVFFILGGWCVVAPASVVALGFRTAYQSNEPITLFLMACFGLQALISGLFALSSRFTRVTFLAYGIGLLPFVALDVYFYGVKPMLTEVGFAGDLIGNLIMLMVCWVGWRRAPGAL